MSKVIRTGRVSGAGGVTLGRHEEGLFYDPAEPRGKAPSIDLAKMIDKHLQTLTGGLEQDWTVRLREEHDTTRAAGERQLAEAEQRHQEEAERLHQERYDEGYADGVTAKEAEAREAVERVAVLHRAMRHERDQVLLDAETLVVDLSLAVARKVTQVQALADPKVVARTVRAALQHLSERSNLVIKVNYEDLQIARRFAAAWVERVEQDAVLRVQVSDHVERGGCMIEGGEENVDARFESQLEVLHEALREQMESAYEARQEAADNGPTDPVTSPAEGADPSATETETEA